jgi:hypothetical protein
MDTTIEAPALTTVATAKKLGLSEAEFEKIMSLPVKKHAEFANEQKLQERYYRFLTVTKKIRRLVGLVQKPW